MFSPVFLITQVCPDVLCLPQQLKVKRLGIAAQMLPAATVCQWVYWLRMPDPLYVKMSVSLLKSASCIWTVMA